MGDAAEGGTQIRERCTDPVRFQVVEQKLRSTSPIAYNHLGYKTIIITIIKFVDIFTEKNC